MKVLLSIVKGRYEIKKELLERNPEVIPFKTRELGPQFEGRIYYLPGCDGRENEPLAIFRDGWQQ
jgi:hypothetical protein